MSNTFTQAIRCFECAYVECRCGRLRRTPQPRAIIATEYRPVSRPADVQPMKTRAAELAPAKVKASVLPPALAEIREKMRRGETVPLTGPGSLAEALKAQAAPAVVQPPAKPAPKVEEVRALFNEPAPNGQGRMGDLIMDGILQATQAKLAL